ncbi:MAG: hypothetical protein JOZ54_06080 [Acidobacteria bacterium]|nr:hypothetical protein [Acidobacteriota bacterium]
MSKRALFIGGSVNQTKQVLAVADALPEVDAYFTPYYCDGLMEVARRLGLLEWTVIGDSWRKHSIDLLRKRNVKMDADGRSGNWDLVVTASDLVIPHNIRHSRIVLVQEGMTDPEGFGFQLRRFLPFLPVWVAGTAGTGTSGMYDRFCVASDGYRDLFIGKGAPAERVVVTGIPNFDDCASYRNNEFPHRDYVLVCTSDTRETFKRDNRADFLRHCVKIAAGRPLIFKLHPNENVERNTKEIAEVVPDALVFAKGSAEEMVANCATLIVQYSTLAYVGLALGKEVFAYTDLALLRRLLPVQGGRAAERIAGVCRDVLRQPVEELLAAREGIAEAVQPAEVVP